MNQSIFNSAAIKGILVVAIIAFGISRCGNEQPGQSSSEITPTPEPSYSRYNPLTDMEALTWSFICMEPSDAFINTVDLNLFERKLLKPEDFSNSLLEIGRHGIAANADAKEYYEERGDSSVKKLGEEFGKFGEWVLAQRMRIESLTVADIKEIDSQYKDLKNQAKLICEKD